MEIKTYNYFSTNKNYKYFVYRIKNIKQNLWIPIEYSPNINLKKIPIEFPKKP